MLSVITITVRNWQGKLVEIDMCVPRDLAEDYYNDIHETVAEFVQPILDPLNAEFLF